MIISLSLSMVHHMTTFATITSMYSAYLGKAEFFRIVSGSVEWAKDLHCLIVSRLSLQHLLKTLHRLSSHTMYLSIINTNTHKMMTSSLRVVQFVCVSVKSCEWMTSLLTWSKLEENNYSVWNTKTLLIVCHTACKTSLPSIHKVSLAEQLEQENRGDN